MSDLSKYLSDKLGDRVPDDIVKAANEAGFSIDRTVVYAYVKGRHAKRPREATLKALAAGFGLDLRDLRELAGHPRGELGRFEVVDEADWLTYRQRKAFNDLILAFVTEEGDQNGTASQQQKTDDGPTTGEQGQGGRHLAAVPDVEPDPGLKGHEAAKPGRVLDDDPVDREVDAAGEENQDDGESPESQDPDNGDRE